MLYETATDIQHNDFAEVNETTNLLKQIKLVLEFYEDHANHENTFVLPALAKYNQQLINDFEKEHEDDHRLVEDLHKHIQQWESAATEEDRLKAGNQIFYAFNEFIAFNLYHMNREEKILNPEFWKYYTDDDIMGWSQQIIRSIPPEKLTIQNHWMFRAVNTKEALIMLNGVSKIAPPDVAQQYLKIAQ